MPLSMIIIIDERGDETKKIMLIVYLPLMTTVKNTRNVSEAESSDPSPRRPHPCDCPRPAMTTLHICIYGIKAVDVSLMKAHSSVERGQPRSVCEEDLRYR